MPCTPAAKGKASRRRYLDVPMVRVAQQYRPSHWQVRHLFWPCSRRSPITLFLLWLLSLYSNSFFPLSSVYSYHSSLALLSHFFFLHSFLVLFSLYVFFTLFMFFILFPCFAFSLFTPFFHCLIYSFYPTFFCLFPLCIKAFADHTFPQKITVTETTSSTSCSPRLLQHQYCHYF